MTATSSPILVVAGLGTGDGTGGAVARRFSKMGYKVALVAHGSGSLKKIADEIIAAGGEAAPFPVKEYSAAEISTVFANIKKEWPNSAVRVAVWNAVGPVWKPFLQITEQDLQKTAESAFYGAFAFSHEAISIFKDLDMDERGTRGTLIFTSATSALRGNVVTSAFSAGKFATRSLSQSLAKEFGKQNIHVATAVIDGKINTALNPSDDPDNALEPDAIAETYAFLAHQHRSAWTWELDLRPAHEKW